MIRVGIVGGTGYTGLELLRLLATHPEVELSVITSRSEAGRSVADLFPSLRGHYSIEFTEPNDRDLLACDLVFFATPHGVAQSMMSNLVDSGARVIDLSADFRLRDIATWEKWYGQTHACPELVSRAVYGLPEVNRERIREANLVACPGCYPTSIQLALKPLLEAGAIETSNIIANSASGISGAGRQAKLGLLLAENSDSFSAYSVAGHRHKPEIQQGLADIAGSDPSSIGLTFVPHLLPIIRGILSTVYVQPREQFRDLAAIQTMFEESYADEPFVDVLPSGQMPQTRSVKGSNFCRLSVNKPDGGDTLVVCSAIDNLAKGASGQAIQNLNIMFGFDERLGLAQPSIAP